MVLSKWFCNVALIAPTPDHTVFTRARARIGTHQLSKIFADVSAQLQQHGYMNEVFTCIDASHLIAKANLWEERDRAIQQKYAKLNNEVLPKEALIKSLMERVYLQLLMIARRIPQVHAGAYTPKVATQQVPQQRMYNTKTTPYCEA